MVNRSARIQESPHDAEVMGYFGSSIWFHAYMVSMGSLENVMLSWA